MKIVVGLGNPGSRYRETRHNIGWLLLDRVAETLGKTFEAGRGDYEILEGRRKGRPLALVKPLTFMNLSGNGVRQVLRHLKGGPEDLLIVFDEIQLPVGRLKLTGSGSDGGHNGVSSVIAELGTENFARLRCGVGNNFGTGRMAEYVLDPFAPEEIESRDLMITDGASAILTWVHEGTAKGMNRVNRRAPKPAKEKKSTGQAEASTDSSEQSGDDRSATDLQ